MTAKTAGSNTNDFLKFYLLLILLAVMVIHFAGCNGCNKPVNPQPSAPQVIEQQAKPKEDSLLKELAGRDNKIAVLEKQLQASKKNTAAAKQTAGNSKAKTEAAFERGDAVAIINSLKEQVTEYENVIISQDKDLTIQTALLLEKDSVANAAFSFAELQKSKFKKLAAEYTHLEAQNKKQSETIARINKKLKRNKAVLRIAAPLAITGITSSIAPQYTIPAAAVGVVIYIISKPKRDKQ
jgi:hypothetical protein